MTFDILPGQPINLQPASEAEEILQNVRTILGTPRGSCMMNRQFGVDAEALGRPLPVAQAAITANIVEAVARWEPRAKVRAVRWEGDGEAGILRPIVTIEVA